MPGETVSALLGCGRFCWPAPLGTSVSSSDWAQKTSGPGEQGYGWRGLWAAHRVQNMHGPLKAGPECHGTEGGRGQHVLPVGQPQPAATQCSTACGPGLSSATFLLAVPVLCPQPIPGLA